MWKRTVLLTVAAFGLGGLVAATALGWSRLVQPVGKVTQPAWNEVAWPFPMDQWGGRPTKFHTTVKNLRLALSSCGAHFGFHSRASLCASDSAYRSAVEELDHQKPILARM